MNTSVELQTENSVVAKLTWRVVPYLFLLYVVAYLDRINVGFAALQMQKQLGFNDSAYGLGAGIFFAGYFIFQVPSNLVLERVGARRWIAALMVAWGVISASMALVTTPRGFYILRFLLGAAEAGFFPGVILYLKQWFPAGAQARTVAWFMTAAPLSGVVGSPISGALLELHHLGLAGWQWLFLMEGTPAVILGFVSMLFLTDKPEDARFLHPEQKAWLIDTLRREKESHPYAGRSDVRAAFTSGRVWLLALAYFGLTTGMYGIGLWLPSVIHSLSGVSTFVIGLLAAIPYVAAAIAMVVVGFHSDRSGERRWHVALTAFVGALALAMGAYATSLAPEIIALSLALMAVFAMCGPFWAIPSNLLTGTAAAAGIALINSIGNLGGFFGPYIIGLVRTSTGGFGGGLLVVGVCLALSGCVILLVHVQAAGTREEELSRG
jgi:ACS family tartrate transporter-like MFS transporter